MDNKGTQNNAIFHYGCILSIKSYGSNVSNKFHTEQKENIHLMITKNYRSV